MSSTTRTSTSTSTGASTGAAQASPGPASPPGSRPAGTGADSLRQDEPRRPRDFGIDTARLRRLRLIVFGVLALPLLVLALLALKFVSMPITQAWHDGAYDEKDYGTAIQRLEPVWFANWFEPYLPHLTRGTDLLQQGDNAAAEKELRVALTAWNEGSDLNRPQHAQCKILNNLAISIERQAIEIPDAAQRADRLFEAEELLAPCAGGGGGGEGEGQGGGQGNEDKETTGENGKRVEEERRQADEESGQDPDAREKQGDQPSDQTGSGGAPPSGPGSHENPSGTGDPQEATTEGDATEQQKKDELEERNSKANGGEGESSSGGSQQNPDKPW